MYIGKYHKFKVVGICLSGIQDDHMAHIVSAISDELNARGYKVLIFNSFSDLYYDTPFTKGEASVFGLADSSLVDAVIIFPESMKSESVVKNTIDRALSNGKHVISVNSVQRGCTGIVYDYESAFEDIVRHVVEHHGCRDVYMVAGMRDNSFSDDRINVYKKVLKDNGIEFDPEKVGYGDFWSGPTVELMDKYFEEHDTLPDAFVCANDTMALTVASCIREHGFKVPEDVIVTGFDAVITQRIYSVSEITSAIIDVDVMSGVIADTVDRYLEGHERPREKLIPFKRINAPSCGCSNVNNTSIDEKLLKMNDYNYATMANETWIAEYTTEAVSEPTLEHITNTMGRYADRHSWVCVNSSLLGDNADGKNSMFAEDMTALVWRDGTNKTFNAAYKLCDLLPDIGKALRTYNKLMFSPIHFQNEVMGYYCVACDYIDLTYNSFHNVRRFASATNQILENCKNSHDLRCAYDELENIHSIDPLTEMYNRHGFYIGLERLIKRLCPENTTRQAVVISIDMDNLKTVNDEFGHSAGDESICAVAQAVKNACTGLECIYSRSGGDEFMIAALCDDAKYLSVSIVESIQAHIYHYNATSDKDYTVAISIGTAFGEAGTLEELERISRESDHNMYKQKRIKKSMQNNRSIGTPAPDFDAGACERRIHEVFTGNKEATYFYIRYDKYKWYVIQTESTPQCMLSDTMNPLRTLKTSGAIYEDDRAIYDELMLKIERFYKEGVKQTDLSVQIRLMTDGNPEWYVLTLILVPDSENRLCELVGKIIKATVTEKMMMEVQNYYTTTDNPLLLNDIISSVIAKNSDKRYAIIHFDIKQFKFINENFGEDTGTQLLYHIANQLKAYCSDDQLSARINSDIFMLLTPYKNVEDIYDIISVIEKRIKGFRQISYEFVFGVYLIDDMTLHPRIMGDRASIARHSVKNNAIQNIAFYDNNMLQAALVRKFVESNMNSALENQEFVIYLQPKFSISKKQAVGFEALVRWIHPERGMIPPGDFIPLFEENGFVIKLDAYVWECTCTVIRDWIDRGFEPLPISVNVSRMHLKDDQFIRILDALIQKYDIPKELLELEITESAENENSVRMTDEIKKHGYSLLMDDFGSGYSSLNTLKSTKFDILKIDREFLSSFLNDDRGKKIISHTINMSQDVGLELIAEGVETLEQAKFLESCGCDTAQGFYYARPMPVQDAEQYLAKKTVDMKRHRYMN